MLQIKDTLVSLDILERFFLCDLGACKGECCIEGDAGAPITAEEYETLQRLTPLVWDMLTPAARRVLEEQGPGYYDEDGDLVTSIVDGRDCVFTTYEAGGLCSCALEKLYRSGGSDFYKPISCHLYPVRLRELPGGMTAVNCHRWKVCRAAETLGRAKGVRVYQFLREPLIRRFGQEWYDELCEAAAAWLSQNEAKP